MSNENQRLYTKQELDIELIKQKTDSFAQTLTRIESRMDWMLGTFIGMNALIITGLLTALGKAFHFF